MPNVKTSRRAMMTALALSPASTFLSATSRASERSVSSLEADNEKLVNRFCADWSKRDPGLLADYFADDIVYQLYDEGPILEGPKEFVDQMGDFIRSAAKIDWEVLRSQAIGPLVTNERVDRFVFADGKHQEWTVAGIFVVKNGKIEIWRDYLLAAPPEGSNAAKLWQGLS